LIAASFSFAVSFGILAGVVSGIYRGSWLDRVIMPLVTLGVSMPSFYLGMVLLVVFAARLSWLPAGGFMSISSTRTEWPDVLRHIVLPAITLGSAPLAVIARTLRTSVLEEVSKHYVRTARAKGLSELRITAIHVFKNALIPMVHLLGLQVGFLLASTALVEVVFGYPGLGDLLIRSIITRDLPLTQGIVLVLTLCYVLINLIADVAHGMLDPRLRHE
jgi:peptide/nickel transport system permease protein